MLGREALALVFEQFVGIKQLNILNHAQDEKFIISCKQLFIFVNLKYTCMWISQSSQ